MEIIILIAAMVLVGLITTVLAGVIWKGERPYGISGDMLAASLTAIIFGLIDWYVIPAMGFSDTMKIIGIMFFVFVGCYAVYYALLRLGLPEQGEWAHTTGHVALVSSHWMLAGVLLGASKEQSA